MVRRAGVAVGAVVVVVVGVGVVVAVTDAAGLTGGGASLFLSTCWGGGVTL